VVTKRFGAPVLSNNGSVGSARARDCAPTVWAMTGFVGPPNAAISRGSGTRAVEFKSLLDTQHTSLFAYGRSNVRRVGLKLNPRAYLILAKSPRWGTYKSGHRQTVGAQSWPAPNRPLPLFDNTGAPNLFVTTRALNDVDSLIGKIDHSFNKDNQLTAAILWHQQSIVSAGNSAGNVLLATTPSRRQKCISCRSLI